MSIFRVTQIDARSDLPLYIIVGTTRTVVPTAWQILWRTPNPVPASAAAFNLVPPPNTLISFRLTCTFSTNLVGRAGVTIQGLLNGVVAIESFAFDIGSVGPTLIQQFVLVNRRDSPIAYRGSFQWRLMAGITILATFQTLTPLELYTAAAPPAALWAAYGVSVNLLRQYAAPWNAVTSTWNLANFYRFITEGIFGGTFRYDNVYGGSRFVVGPSPGTGGQFRLDEYFRQLEAGQTGPVNCYDMAGIVQIVLSLYRNYTQGFWIFMRVYGWIPPSNLKGFGNCNNPFFANTVYDPLQIAPVNPPQIPFPPGFRRRSDFANHAFILAPTSTPNVTCVLDATSGPHIGNQNLDTYINTAIDRTTTYYTAIPNSGPGTTANIDPEHRGITSLIQTTSFSMPAPPPAAVTEASAFSPVDDAMERAKVPNADPPRFSQVDPTGLKSLLREKTASSLTFETVLPSQHESVVHWTFGSAPEEVEITVIVFEAHNAAIQGMRTALHSISAPLNEVFTSTLGLGQLTLEGVGGYGFILFVRDNVFVSMKGLPSSEKLGEIAAPVDAFLKKKEDDPKRIPAPPTEPGDLPTRQVQAGTEFEVAVKVANAGWMTASTDLTVVQLLEVDKASATFKFFAVAAGTADIYLVFAHEDTLQTTTKKVKIEVIGDSNEEAQVVIREVEI